MFAQNCIHRGNLRLLTTIALMMCVWAETPTNSAFWIPKKKDRKPQQKQN